MYYLVCGTVHLKDSLLLSEKNNPCSGGTRFPLSVFEWSLTIYPMPYNRKYKCVEFLPSDIFVTSKNQSSQCSMTGITEVMVCVILYVG